MDCLHVHTKEKAKERPNLWAMPHGVPFLKHLAKGLCTQALKHDDPTVALSQTIVFLPTEKAVRTLNCELLRHAQATFGKQTIFLPHIFTLGHLFPAVAYLMRHKTPQTLLEARCATSEQRTGLLLQLIFESSQNLPMTCALAMANALTDLLDRALIEEVCLEKIDTLIPEQFAQHWQNNLAFLDIVIKIWPQLLKEKNLVESYAFERQCADELSQFIRTEKSLPAVIIAGSTGTAKRVVRLMQAVLYAGGDVVLPGFDFMQNTDEALTDGHPQAGLHKLLHTLKTPPALWPTVKESTHHQNTKMHRDLLHLAFSETKQNEKQITTKKTPNITLIETDTLSHEALAVSLFLRDMQERSLKDKPQSITVVVADPKFEKYLKVHLGRFNLSSSHAAGALLSTHPCARFLMLLLNCAHAPENLYTWLDMLKHPLVGRMLWDDTKGSPLRPVSLRLKTSLIQLFEQHILRCDEPLIKDPQWTGVVVCRVLLRRINKTTIPKRLHAGLRFCIKGIQPLLNLKGIKKTNPSIFCTALQKSTANFLGAKMRDETFKHSYHATLQKNEDKGLDTVLDTLDALCANTDCWPTMSLEGFRDFLSHAFNTKTIPEAQTKSHITFVGPRDLRLASSDIICLTTLNEGIWPGVRKDNPWLSKSMRNQLDLCDEKRLLQLASHDFTEACARPCVVLSRAKRTDGSDTTPSRFLQRMLNTCRTQGVTLQKTPYAAWAAQIDTPTKIASYPAPEPKPPQSLRPRTFSPTSFELLKRNPYGFYARYILKLSPLKPLGGEITAAFLGNLMHRILECFTQKVRKIDTNNLEAKLAESFAKATQHILKPYKHHPSIHFFYAERIEAIADDIVHAFCDVFKQGGVVHSEQMLAHTFHTKDGPLTLRGRADAVHIHQNGTTIIDYKTGTLPKSRDVEEGFAPQLSLLGALHQKNATHDNMLHPLIDLCFWHLTQKGLVKKSLKDAEKTAQNTLELFLTDVAHALNESTPFVAEPLPSKAPTYNIYKHLARTAEWRRG